MDYTVLNNVTMKDKFPIPIVEELLDELSVSMVFSKMDLQSGCRQIRVRLEDVPNTTFITSSWLCFLA